MSDSGEKVRFRTRMSDSGKSTQILVLRFWSSKSKHRKAREIKGLFRKLRKVCFMGTRLVVYPVHPCVYPVHPSVHPTCRTCGHWLSVRGHWRCPSGRIRWYPERLITARKH